MASSIIDLQGDRAQAASKASFQIEHLSGLLSEIEEERNQVQAIAIAGTEYATRTEEHSTERYLFESIRRLSESATTLKASRNAIAELSELFPAQEKAEARQEVRMADRATTPDGIAGFTQEQLELLLEKIATIANTLARHCAKENCEHSLEVGDGFHIAGLMAEQIGSLADHAIGAGVVGDFPAWMIATGFSARGKEARHG